MSDARQAGDDKRWASAAQTSHGKIFNQMRGQPGPRDVVRQPFFLSSSF